MLLPCLKTLVCIPTWATIRYIGYSAGIAPHWDRYLVVRFVEHFRHGYIEGSVRKVATSRLHIHLTMARRNLHSLEGSEKEEVDKVAV
jgi:hypothetical protein